MKISGKIFKTVILSCYQMVTFYVCATRKHFIMRNNHPRYHLYLKRNIKKLERRRVRLGKIQGVHDVSLFQSRKPSDENLPEAYDVTIPRVFSIIDNPNETIDFFNKTLRTIIRGTESNLMHFDFRQVEHITIDALMYLIAIVMNLKISICKIRRFGGNRPENKEALALYERSGFEDIVENRKKFIKNKGTSHIMFSNQGEPNKTLEICEHIINRSKLERTDILFLGEMLGELEGNAIEHAYNDSTNSRFHRRWFIYLDDSVPGKFAFTFLDIGLGIWATMQKNFAERVKKFGGNSAFAIIDALEGGFRTRTKVSYRGKGLPSIRGHASKRQIKNLKIVTSKAYCFIEENDCEKIKHQRIDSSLKGTLFYWEVIDPMYRKDEE